MASAEEHKRPSQTFSDERLLREIGEARDAGAPARSHDAALLLAARHHGRIRGLVAAFEFPGQPGVRIPADEYDDVTQDAWGRVVKMLGNLRQTDERAFRAALKTAVMNACKDYSRARVAHERGLAGSLDEPRVGPEYEEHGGRFDPAVAELSTAQEEARSDARATLDALAEALDRLPDPRVRKVVRRRIEGYPPAEIATELGLTRANVDQLFSRGIKRIGGLIVE